MTQDVNALGGKKTRDGILGLSANLMVAEAAENAERRLEKWGRFTLVPDIKGADLAVRAYEKGETNYVPVISLHVAGSVNVGQSFFILDVWQPSSRKVIWSASKNVGTGWSTHTGIANLVKRLREYIEEQEKSQN